MVFFYLEDFNLAAGGMDVLHVLPTFVGGEGVHLDPEGHTFLAAVLPGGELSADAVHLLQRVGKSQVVAGCWRLGGVRGPGSSSTWMNTEAVLAGSQRNSTVLRCRGCEQGSRIPTDNGISADIPRVTRRADVFYASDLRGGEVHSGKMRNECSTHGMNISKSRRHEY